MKSTLLSGIFSLATLAAASAQTDSETDNLFTINCSACHLMDTSVVGPSLAEIRELYLGKPDEFVKWAMAPGKKRPGAIEMPAMVHVGEPGLRAIYEHIMEISKEAKQQKAVSGDPFANAPAHTARPTIQRIFMPDAGPASIAVALDDQISLTWDAGPCRLRYAWTGGFIDGYPYWKNNGSSLAKIIGTVRYTEPEALFPGTPKFHGYEVKNGLPTFHYTIGPQKITETFEAISGGIGFHRHFTTTLKPKLPPSTTLTPTPTGFTLTTTFP